MMPSCGSSPSCHRMVYIKFPDIFVSTAITKSKDSEIVLPRDIASMMTEPGCFQRSGATWRPKLCALHWELPMNVLGRNSFIVVLSSGTLRKQEWFQQKQSCCNLSLIFWCWCCEFSITEAATTLSPQVLAQRGLFIQRHIQRIINVTQESNSFRQLKSAEGMNGTKVRNGFAIFLTSCQFFNFLSMWMHPLHFKVRLFLLCRTSRTLKGRVPFFFPHTHLLVCIWKREIFWTTANKH